MQGTYGISGSVKPTNKRIKELENQLAQYQGWDTNGGGARAKATAKAKSGGKGDAARPRPCWDEAKGKGTCSRGDSCWFSHDPQVRKEFNKGKGKGSESQALENEVAKARGRGGRGRGAEPRAKAKAKATGATRVKFPDCLCHDVKAGKECSRGKDCPYSHDLKHFDENGKPKPKKTQGSANTTASSTGGDQPQAGVVSGAKNSAVG